MLCSLVYIYPVVILALFPGVSGGDEPRNEADVLSDTAPCHLSEETLGKSSATSGSSSNITVIMIMIAVSLSQGPKADETYLSIVRYFP